METFGVCCLMAKKWAAGACHFIGEAIASGLSADFARC